MIVISPENANSNNPISSKEKDASIIVSDSGYFFLNLKTKQGKIIGRTRDEAIQHLKDMDRRDDFPDL
jgi:hypothetical protein